MMLHTKSLIRRLDCVRWFLAAGLILGLVGIDEARAQDKQAITLKIDKFEVSESAGAKGKSVDIKVTASVADKAAAAIRIGLDFRSEEADQATDADDNVAPDQPTHDLLTAGVSKVGEGTRFRLEGMTNPIVIAKDAKSGSVTIKLFPVDDKIYDETAYASGDSDDDGYPHAGGDLYIGFVASYLQGTTQTTVTQTATTLRLIDDDRPFRPLDLATTPPSSRTDPPTVGEVGTVTINSEPLRLTFSPSMHA